MSFWNDFFKLFYYGRQEPLTKKQPPPVPTEPIALGEYQRLAFTVAKYPECGTGSIMAIVYCGLGLGEAGEVQGKIKKVLRDSNSRITPEIREALIAEMGDNLWYLAAMATELGVSLEEVGKKNLDKLFDRKERGVIGGSGDKR